MKHCDTYLTETIQLLQRINPYAIKRIVDELRAVKDSGGRVFCLGVGGSAATASHAVNDLRKICGIEAYCPTDNVALLTAITNDQGWEDVFDSYLSDSRFGEDDALFIFSVGGGSWECGGPSQCITDAVREAKGRGGRVLGIVGRNGGFTKSMWDAGIIIEPNYPDRITPHTEGLAGVVLHCIVSHQELAR